MCALPSTGSPLSSVGTFAAVATVFHAVFAPVGYGSLQRSVLRMSGRSSNRSGTGSTHCGFQFSNKCFLSYDCPEFTSITQSSMTRPEMGQRKASGASDSDDMEAASLSDDLGRRHVHGRLDGVLRFRTDGAQITPHLRGAFQHNRWCRMRSPVTLHPARGSCPHCSWPRD